MGAVGGKVKHQNVETIRIDIYSLVQQKHTGTIEEWTMTVANVEDPESDTVLVEIGLVPIKRWMNPGKVETPVRIHWRENIYEVWNVVSVLSDREKEGHNRERFLNGVYDRQFFDRYGCRLYYPNQDLILQVDTRPIT